MPLPRSLGMLLVTLSGAAFLLATQVWAQRGSCVSHSTPAFLGGFVLNVSDPARIDAWAERFGFGEVPAAAPGGLERTLRLRRGFLSWISQVQPPVEDLDTHIGWPCSTRNYYLDGTPEPPAEPFEADVPVPPNGARRVLRAIAVDADNVSVEDAFTFRSRSPQSLRYGGSFAVPEAGAVVHDVSYPSSGDYRFVFATGATGLAARWMRQGPPRWIGATFEVADLQQTERALAERDVPVVHVHEQLGEGLWVMPEVTGGPLLEFVQPRYH